MVAQEAKKLAILLWVGTWAIVAVTALTLVVGGWQLHHLVVLVVAVVLAGAPFGIRHVLERRVVAPAVLAFTTTGASTADGTDPTVDDPADDRPASAA